LDNLTLDQRRKNMQAIRSKHTKLEIKVAKALWHKGLRLRRNVSDLFGKPDFSIKKYKAVVFIDSCFWHGCEIHGNYPKTNEDYWLNKITRNKQRDREVEIFYNSMGWSILRMWEHEIKNNFNCAIQKIVDFIRASKGYNK
jgi:DNA mismatch endonuclease (patch repair protein)